MKIAVLLSVCLGFPIWAGAATVEKDPGHYPSPNQECIATIKIAEMGGFAQLSIAQVGLKRVPKPIDDVSGFAWIDPVTFVYSVSPIYGVPGVFVGTCAKGKPIRTSLIDRPKKFSRGYPKGSDYYELESIDGRDVRYYYAPWVDGINFHIFRRPIDVKLIAVK